MLTEVPAADTPMLLPLGGLCELLLAIARLNDPVAVTVPLSEACDQHGKTWTQSRALDRGDLPRRIGIVDRAKQGRRRGGRSDRSRLASENERCIYLTSLRPVTASRFL
jgi:hypothetical protein